MRPIHPNLVKRIRRADIAARVIVEAVQAVQEAVKDLQSEWAASDSFVGYKALERGGAKMSGTESTIVTQPTNSGTFITDLDNVPTYKVAEIIWGHGGDKSREIHQLVARLVAQRVGGEPKTVVTWRAQLFRVSNLQEADPEDGDGYELQPITDVVDVDAVGGTTPADVTFAFTPSGLDEVAATSGDGPDGDSKSSSSNPRTIVMVWAVAEDGSAADNIGWDTSGNDTPVTSGFHTINGIELNSGDGPVKHTGKTIVVFSGSTLGVPTFSLKGVDYATPVVITFTVNPLDLGAAPTAGNDIEVVATGETPSDTSLLFEINDGGGWVACVDGDLIGVDNSATSRQGSDLSGVAKQQSYDARVTMTSNTNQDQAPVVRRFGVREINTTDLDGIAVVRDPQWAIDPDTFKGEITETVIEVLKDGETDYRDWATELLTERFLNEFFFRVMIGHPDLPRSQWLHIDDFYIDDFNPKGATIQFTCLSAIQEIRQVLPAFDSVAGEREKLVYSNETLAAAYSDIISGQVGLASRLIGVGILATDTVSKTIENSDAKDELDALAYIAGGGLTTSQGKVVFKDITTRGPPAYTFGKEEIAWASVQPGLRSRVPEFFVPFSWIERKRRYDSEARSFHPTALSKLGVARLDTVPVLEDIVARWIDVDALAKTVANRKTMLQGAGLIRWDFQSTYPHPELEVGDTIVVHTDRFVAKDPLTDNEIRGEVWATAVITAVKDILGTRFEVWVRTVGDMTAVESDVTVIGFAFPEILAGAAVLFLADGSVRFQGQVDDAEAVRASVVSSLPFPDSAAVDGESLHAVDSDGWFDFEVAAAGSFVLGDTAYLSAHAYEKADGSGARSEPIFKSSRSRTTSQLDGKIWVEIDTAAKTLDVNVSAEGASDLFPATLTIYQNDPEGAPIDLDGLGDTEHSFTASGQTIGPVGSGATTEYSGLTDIVLPKKASLRYFGKLTAASGAVRWLFSMGDLDRLPGGSTTALDYAAKPSLRTTYDDDVPEIVVTTPGGPKTFTGLSGGGLVTYTIGDSLDDASTESDLTEGETRSGYKVTLYSVASASGLSLEVFDGALHGINANEPNWVAITAAGWSLLGTILNFKLYYFFFNISLGPDTQSIEIEYDPGTGAISYIYDTSGAERHPLKDSDGSTTFATINTHAGFTIKITPYTGTNAAGDAGSPVEIETGPTAESGSGTAAKSQDGTTITGNALQTIPLFDIDNVDGEPRLILQAIHDFGDKAAGFSLDAVNGGSQEGSISANVSLTSISNLVGVEPFSVRVSCGANILTLGSQAFEGPKLTFTGNCAISFMDFGTGKIVAMGADY